MPTTPDQLSRRLEPGVLITLYELDLTSKTSNFTGQPGTIYRFHDGIDPTGTNIVNFKGQPYNPFPIKAEGYEWTTQGTLPRPKLSVSNIGSVTSALLREFDDLVGALVTVRRTYTIYLDGQAEGGSPYKEFTPLIYVVDRKSGETTQAVAFELATGMDAEGVLLPRRQIMATACPWTYRGPECSYTGPPLINRLGKPFGVTYTDGTTYDRIQTFNDGLTNWNSPQLASNTAQFTADDVGKAIAGMGIPNGAVPTTIISVQNTAVITMSRNVFLAYPSGGATFTIPGRARSGLSSPSASFSSANLQQVVTSDRLPTGTKIVLVRDAHNVELSQKALSNGATTFTLGNILGPGGAAIGPYNQATTYAIREGAYKLINGIRVYAVSKAGGNLGNSITDENWWMLDVCLKKQSDCEIHFGKDQPLPFGGFPGVSKLTGG
jgi:lambda family phage minor tail protein L